MFQMSRSVGAWPGQFAIECSLGSAVGTDFSDLPFSRIVRIAVLPSDKYLAKCRNSLTAVIIRRASNAGNWPVVFVSGRDSSTMPHVRRSNEEHV